MSGLVSLARAFLLGVTCVLCGCATTPESPGRENGGSAPTTVLPAGGGAGTGGVSTLPMMPGGGVANGSAGSGVTAIAGSGSIATPTVTGTIPCDVSSVVASRCQTCHGPTLIGGAPMHLVTYADFQADLVVKTTTGLIGQTMKAYTLAQQRIHATTARMPPGAPIPDAELATLDAWLASGAPSGPATDASCSMITEPPPIVGPPPTVDPDETCYDLPMHGGQTDGDTSPFTIQGGERYHCFYFEAPWPADVVATRFGNAFQNAALIHHWLLYTTNTVSPGMNAECTGSHIGDNAQLLSGWAVGGQDLVMPADTGLELPASGSGLLVEWHLYNTSSGPTPDTSAMRVCTVPKSARAKIGSMTSLGTEDFGFGIPPGQSEYGSTCVPSRAGMNATDPIHIFTILPHMHKYGRNLRSVVNRAAGGQEEVFSEPFDFMQQIHYDVSIDLMPGDTITSTCTFVNDGAATVSYGNSSDQEMCYQFVLSSPAGALKNGAFGLNGASTNCW